MRLSLLLVALALAAPVRAQTTDLVALLAPGPSGSSPASGMALVRLTDNPAPGGDVVVVRGQFRGLQSPYAASRIRGTAAGPVVQNLTAGFAEGGLFGGWGAAENTFGVADEVTAALLAGTATVEVATGAAPAGEIVGRLVPLSVVVDGRLDEPAYGTVGTKQNANAGFGPDIDVTSTRVSIEAAGVAVIGLTGRLNTASNDGVALWVGTGLAVGPGTSLGGTPGAGHYLGAADHPNFKADFPVGLAFALNPGSGTQSVFVDVVQYQQGAPTTVRTADFLGAAAQDGGVAIGPPDLTAGDGAAAPPLRDVAFAFLNDGAPSSGFEILLPLDALGPFPVARGDGIEVTLAAFVVSSTAFFSDVTVPGNVTTGNPGFDPDFRSVPGGPFFATGGGAVALAAGPAGASALRLVGPNPAGIRTRLALTLPAAGPVRVDVLDALGRVVAVLHDGPAAAGDLRLDVDASRLPAGVYVVRAAGPGVRSAQRLTVAR